MIFDNGVAIPSRVRRLWFFITWAQEEISRDMQSYNWNGESRDDTLSRWIRLYLGGDLDYKLLRRFNAFYDLSNPIPGKGPKVDGPTDRKSP
jgi:hypothetical protein